ncbi:deleted in malignant brain tumors 1 protein-like [Strongylocentrotus purpuratus]|uniref:SRCR domain-containing protein n=1 Tax=Strongylocentrotus purpuratus TaxID=7668 RepID=A0A7M7SUC7_STRPU|nr:deleted in malignant brain tumors 1 protein-like [Strongylocentrotus purpuratus]
MGKTKHSFGPGSGDIVEDIQCPAFSATLRDCNVGSNFENTVGCSHNDDVGVVCDGTKFVSGAVRLVNGNVPYAGRVEMFTGERWGSVCDVAWDIEDAHVVCRQVGFKRATYAKKGAFFGRNSDRVVSTGYNCRGTELTHHDCPLSHGTLLSDCTHDNDSSVICEQDSYAEYSVELTGNATYQSSRVSVFHDGQWKSVCSDNWDWRAAQVTCRQAGYVGTSHTVDENAFIDYHPMVFTAHDIVCDGSEYHLYYCSLNWDSRTCVSNMVASVSCATSYEDILQDGDIRLSNGSSSKDGQVEMFDESYWTPICGDDWGWEEATVSCRQLGYLGAITSYTTIEIHDGTEFIWSGLDCHGNEYRLQECYVPNTGWELTSHCQRIGGAECALSQALLRENGDVKLVPDGDSYSGTVAVFYRGVWGKVCPDDWSWSLANTVCIQLGYYGAIEATQNLPDTDDALDYHIHSLQCNEFESHLKYCNLDYAWEDEVECDLDSHLAAGVVCTHQYQDVPSYGKPRLVDGPDAGHVEVFLTESWGLVCGDSWSYDNARVICIHLGYRAVLTTSSIPVTQDFPPVLLYVA